MQTQQNNIKGNLLIVEDEPVIANVCRRILAQEGFNVIMATNGDMAVELLGKHEFNLCLFDIRTPGMDGLALYEYICQKYPRLTRRVIFMTGDALSRNVQNFANTAGCYLLQKPFTIEQLLTAVKHYEI